MNIKITEYNFFIYFVTYPYLTFETEEEERKNGTVFHVLFDKGAVCPKTVLEKIRIDKDRTKYCFDFNEWVDNPCLPWGHYLNASRACIRHIPTQMTWDEAQVCCLKANMSLVEINDRELDDDIKDMIRVLGARRGYWMGLTNRNRDTYDYRWISRQNWLPEYLNLVNGSSDSQGEKCVIGADPGNHYKWVGVGCDFTYAVVCLKTIPPPNPPQISLDYHKTPSFLFIGNSLWAWCSALDSRVYFPGVGKQDFTEHPYSDKLLDGTCRPRAMSVRYIRITPDLNASQIVCCATSLFHRGHEMCTTAPNFTLMERPDPNTFLKPELSLLNLSEDQTVVFWGQVMRITCSAYIEYNGYLLLQLAPNGTGKESNITAKDSNVNSYQTVLYKDRWIRLTGNDKDKYRTINVSLNVTQEMDGKAVSCCSHTVWGRRLCDRSLVLNVHIRPEPPCIHLGVNQETPGIYVGQSMTINCTVKLGTLGQLVWELYSPRDDNDDDNDTDDNEDYKPSLYWAFNNDWLRATHGNKLTWLGTLLGSSRGVMLLFSTRQEETEHPYQAYHSLTVSELRLDEVPKSLDGARFACHVTYEYLVNGTTNVTSYRDISEPLNVLYPVRRASEKVTYKYETTEDGRHYLYGACTAHVGEEGVMTWSLRNEALSWTVDTEGTIQGPKNANVIITSKYGMVDEWLGPFIETNFTLLLQSDERRSDLYCFNFNGTDYTLVVQKSGSLFPVWLLFLLIPLHLILGSLVAFVLCQKQPKKRDSKSKRHSKTKSKRDSEIKRTSSIISHSSFGFRPEDVSRGYFGSRESSV